MKNHFSNNTKNILLPCLAFSIITGIISALIITVFQLLAEHIIKFSVNVYGFVQQNPNLLPWLLIGAVAIGLVSSFILSASKSCRGGGIPTSIAAGIVGFKWLASVLLLPVSALLSFLCGIPLGTEGPCVQMGTGIGDGVVQLFSGKKYIGWRRYVMTGGAAAGFSLVTKAPVTAILFSMEELHKRFSPLLFSVASISVISSQITSQILAYFGFSNGGLFHIHELKAVPVSLLYLPIVVGLLCGAASILFTEIYHKIDKFMCVKLAKISIKIKIPIIFVSVALIGFFVFEILGTGHSLVDAIFEREVIWYVLIIVFFVRLILMMTANTSGVTGGVFLPTLAFGAIIGSLCAEAFIGLGIVDSEHYIIFVVLGMTSFLGAASRIPITACVFAIEALNGINNILSITIAATVAFLIAEMSGTKDFTDAVVESKEHEIYKGKTPYVIQVPLTVYENSFVVGKELKNILWPVSCVVLSIDRVTNNETKLNISVGDVITVYYKTYDPIATAEEFEILVGDQSADIDKIMRPAQNEDECE